MMDTQARRTRSTFGALLMLAGAATIPLAGCEQLESQTGLNKSTQTGALGGAAFGGIVAALANANPAWIAASVVLGGVAGGAIGNHLGREDAEQHASRNLNALDTLAEGQTERWSNSETGNSGSTTIHRVARNSDGSVCKEYTETVRTREETVTRDGRACRAPGGGWAVATG
jgi:surface antigen